MARASTVFAIALLCAALLPGAASASGPTFTPGAAGAGDPYYPLDGNGGYDVKHYDLDLRYDPSTDILGGTATIDARATQNLSRFDLDLVGLNVRSVRIDGRSATWTRDGQELVITPGRGLVKGSQFSVAIRYDGIPEPITELFGGISGFIATDDGAIVAGQPHGAAYWFPANDHPTDKASFSFEISAPRGLQVVANGKLLGQDNHNGWTTWDWDAPDPMATYLATINIGKYKVTGYNKDRIRYLDAIDPDLFKLDASPHSGSRYAYSQRDDESYKRLLRSIAVPPTGGSLSFWVNRDTEFPWDFFFVEVHPLGSDQWTTLPDSGGHSSQDTGASCPFWLGIHPFLGHYQADNGDGTCTPAGDTGDWNAATGAGDGWEHWSVDLSAYKNQTVELSLSYASDDIYQAHGVYIDDIVGPLGRGTTSFETDGNPMDGWTVPGGPAGSPANDNDWITGTTSIAAPSRGANIEASFARLPEMLKFLAADFGPYPWTSAGGIVDDIDGLGFALETQTRPTYSKDFFYNPGDGDSVVVHENMHQWYGDSLAVSRWSDIWLNEGFATYAEWLWSEHEGGDDPQAIFDFFANVIPDDDPFWALTIGDPGAGHEFDFPVYARGAMTLQALRQAVGDDAFFKIMRRWAKIHAGGNVSTDQFIALAETTSGQDLGDLFDTWLYTPSKPVTSFASVRRSAVVADMRHAPAAAISLFERYGKDALTRLEP